MEKKLICILLLLFLFVPYAIASDIRIDLSNLSPEQLIALQKQVAGALEDERLALPVITPI